MAAVSVCVCPSIHRAHPMIEEVRGRGGGKCTDEGKREKLGVLGTEETGLMEEGRAGGSTEWMVGKKREQKIEDGMIEGARRTEE